MKPAITPLIEDLHSQQPIRVWSLIITVFGDAIVPRGGTVWLGTVLTLMHGLGITSNAVRAAMSRLTADGWLIRERIGRNSFYRLAESREREFAIAFPRIYSLGPADWSGHWRIAVLTSDDAENRERLRASLRARGYGSLAGGLFCRPDYADHFTADYEPGLAKFHGRALGPIDQLRELVRTAWALDHIAKAHEGVIARFDPLRIALREGLQLAPLDAVLARILLMHQFRRVALQDPMLPRDLMDKDWPGDRARRICADLYELLLPKSEVWLDENAKTPSGRLPPPDAAFHQRFAGFGVSEFARSDEIG